MAGGRKKKEERNPCPLLAVTWVPSAGYSCAKKENSLYWCFFSILPQGGRGATACTESTRADVDASRKKLSIPNKK